MEKRLPSLLPVLLLTLMAPAWAPAQETEPGADGPAAAELREAIRLYDDALRRADVAAAERFWAAEYVFINPRGERVSRDARVANLREKRTSLDSLSHAPREEEIRTYMDGHMAVYTTLLTIDGRYSGEAERGEFRALVVWVRRDGRWQQVASQMTPIVKPTAPG
jgi:ketosteroid isomerase-like protein